MAPIPDHLVERRANPPQKGAMMVDREHEWTLIKVGSYVYEICSVCKAVKLYD